MTYTNPVGEQPEENAPAKNAAGKQSAAPVITPAMIEAASDVLHKSGLVGSVPYPDTHLVVGRMLEAALTSQQDGGETAQGTFAKMLYDAACPEVLARLIYETVLLPGEEIDGMVMQEFDEARLLETGYYQRAMEAAQMVAWQIRQKEQR